MNIAEPATRKFSLMTSLLNQATRDKGNQKVSCGPTFSVAHLSDKAHLHHNVVPVSIVFSLMLMMMLRRG
jgi:hypothetical protein